VDALVLWREFLGELTVRVVEVPVPGLRHDQPLGGLQPERVHVGDEGEQRGEALAAAHDAEFGRLLDRVDCVGTGIGEPDDLGLRRLRLQQERREIGGRERMADMAQFLAAVLAHDRRSRRNFPRPQERGRRCEKRLPADRGRRAMWIAAVEGSRTMRGAQRVRPGSNRSWMQVRKSFFVMAITSQAY
jgi:hypothetical protein